MSWKTPREEIEPVFPDPSTTCIVHDTVIAEELAGLNPGHRTPDRDLVIWTGCILILNKDDSFR